MNSYATFYFCSCVCVCFYLCCTQNDGVFAILSSIKLNNVLSEQSGHQQDVESEREVWEGVSHENFVKMAEEGSSVGLPPVPYATPRTGLSSVQSAAIRASPERSKSDMRMSPKTPLSTLQRSHSTPLSFEGSQEGTARSRSRPTSDTSRPLRPLQDQLNQIEDETEMIREQTELSHFTGVSEKETEDSIKHPLQAEITEEKSEGEVTGDIVEIKEEEEGEGVGAEGETAEVKGEDVDKVPEVPGEEVLEQREATPKDSGEDLPREVTQDEQVSKSPTQQSITGVEGEGRGSSNECSDTTV